MNLRVLVPGIFTAMAVAVVLMSEGHQNVLTHKVFLIFAAPSVILVVGWTLNQGLRFYWSVIGVYHNSIYHDSLRRMTGFKFKESDGSYSVDLKRVGLSLGESLSEQEFQVMFDPFRSRLLPIPWRRTTYLERAQLPFVAPLDNYLLYESPARDAPGMRWTNIMLALQFGVGLLVGWVLANSVDMSVDAKELLSVRLSAHGAWYLAALCLTLLLPALVHATIISWKEARAYELLAVLLRRGKTACSSIH